MGRDHRLSLNSAITEFKWETKTLNNGYETVDFTREPIIETIITPKEGHKLVIRSSKSAGQEEYFVDAVEIVAFGNALFFRSLERPKAFLVPVSDYEILEVREARMVLKNIGLERSIKIGGGREGALKVPREAEKSEVVQEEEEGVFPEEKMAPSEIPSETRAEVKIDKKRDRRRHYRKRRGREEREEGVKEEVAEPIAAIPEDQKAHVPHPTEGVEASIEAVAPPSPSSLLSSLLQPPPTLISETISRYRQNELFKGAFYLTEEEEYKPHDKVQDLLREDDEEEMVTQLQEPMFVQEHPSEGFSTPEKSEEVTLEKPSDLEKEQLEHRDLMKKILEQETVFPFFSGQDIEGIPEADLPFFIEEEDQLEKDEETSTQESQNNHNGGKLP